LEPQLNDYTFGAGLSKTAFVERLIVEYSKAVPLITVYT